MSLNPRAALLGGLLLAFLTAAPAFLDRYLLSVLIVSLYFAYVGQAWNLLMGYAGLLSLGHALYVGLGAYASAYLYAAHGITPLLGLFVGVAAASLMGVIIGALGFRFRIEGVYFALLTIAFAEFIRIGFDHIPATGGSGGYFLPLPPGGSDPWSLRGGPVLFYYVILGLTVAALALTRYLVNSRVGYQWRAIREDPEAARALGVDVFRLRLGAVALSAGLTSIGGVFTAFYYNTMLPEQMFGIHRSIEMILAPIVGGLGTVFGPIVGAFVLTPMGEGLIALADGLGLNVPGLKAVVYGLALIVIVKFRPGGLWPWIARKLGLEDRP